MDVVVVIRETVVACQGDTAVLTLVRNCVGRRAKRSVLSSRSPTKIPLRGKRGTSNPYYTANQKHKRKR